MKILTEHEKLKEICDLIGYELILEANKEDVKIWDYMWNYEYLTWEVKLDVREIIFTPRFIHLLEFKLCSYDRNWILENLEDPVNYLYNQLGLWQTNCQTDI